MSMIKWDVPYGSPAGYADHKYVVTEKYLDEVRLPIESFGLCSTTKINKGTILI